MVLVLNIPSEWIANQLSKAAEGNNILLFSGANNCPLFGDCLLRLWHSSMPDSRDFKSFYAR